MVSWPSTVCVISHLPYLVKQFQALPLRLNLSAGTHQVEGTPLTASILLTKSSTLVGAGGVDRKICVSHTIYCSLNRYILQSTGIHTRRQYTDCDCVSTIIRPCHQQLSIDDSTFDDERISYFSRDRHYSVRYYLSSYLNTCNNVVIIHDEGYGNCGMSEKGDCPFNGCELKYTWWNPDSRTRLVNECIF